MAKTPKNPRSTPRPIQAVLHRQRQVVWTRHYCRLENALKRSLELAILEGEPKDVVEFTMETESGKVMVLGTAKLHVMGKYTAEWTTVGEMRHIVEKHIK